MGVACSRCGLQHARVAHRIRVKKQNIILPLSVYVFQPVKRFLLPVGICSFMFSPRFVLSPFRDLPGIDIYKHCTGPTCLICLIYVY